MRSCMGFRLCILLTKVRWFGSGRPQLPFPKRKQAIANHSNRTAELIDDPSIDAIYIPLPNGLHYEWALKALKAHKHVLLEKPSTSNASEAASLFRSPLLTQPNAPVLLEAFHARFHPACAAFLKHVDAANVVSAYSTLTCPRYVFPETDIRFDYDIGGGVTMDMGAYTTVGYPPSYVSSSFRG